MPSTASYSTGFYGCTCDWSSHQKVLIHPSFLSPESLPWSKGTHEQQGKRWLPCSLCLFFHPQQGKILMPSPEHFGLKKKKKGSLSLEQKHIHNQRSLLSESSALQSVYTYKLCDRCINCTTHVSFITFQVHVIFLAKFLLKEQPFLANTLFIYWMGSQYTQILFPVLCDFGQCLSPLCACICLCLFEEPVLWAVTQTFF